MVIGKLSIFGNRYCQGKPTGSSNPGTCPTSYIFIRCKGWNGTVLIAANVVISLLRKDLS